MNQTSGDAPIAVLGAGIIGTAIAFELQLAGHSVILVDAGEPGGGASFGNMGSIAISEFAPISRPSTWQKIPKWLIDPEGPVRVRPAYLPRALPWFLRFLAAGLPSRVRALEAAGSLLCERALGDTQDLLIRAESAQMLSHEGCLAVYENQAGFDADAEHRALMDRFNINHDVLSGEALRKLEPELAGDIGPGLLIPDARTIADPHGYVRALLAAFRSRGGRFEHMHVDHVSRRDGKVDGISGDGRRIDISGLVIAMGARSGIMAAAQGEPIPLETERGYHTQIMAPGIGLRHALISPIKSFMVTPVAGGIRVGGTVEIAGLDAPPDFRRSRITVRHANRLLPHLKTEEATEWMGHRPALPDTIPIISRSAKVGNLFYATGHGHLGVTLAATTARLMRDLVSGRSPAIDMTPYRVNRF